MNRTTYLIQEGFSFEDLQQLAAEMGWARIDTIDDNGRSADSGPTWAVDNQGSRLRYVDAPPLRVRHLVIEGPATGDLSDLLGGRLALLTRFAVLNNARLARTDEQRAPLVDQIASVYPDAPDPKAMELILNWYRGGSEPLRTRIVVALNYRAWPEATPLLEEIAAGDKSPQLRANAKAALADARSTRRS